MILLLFLDSEHKHRQSSEIPLLEACKDEERLGKQDEDDIDDDDNNDDDDDDNDHDDYNNDDNDDNDDDDETQRSRS